MWRGLLEKFKRDQYAVPGGEGQIGFFYNSITDNNTASAGFGDGLSSVNPGEVSFFDGAPASQLSNSNPRWYFINAGIPAVSGSVPEPATMLLLAGGLLAMGASRKFVKKT